MKTIALLPFRNEAHVLPSYLSSVKPVVDEIIAIDDGSTDSSRDIMVSAGATVYSWEEQRLKSGWAELGIRQRLLELGRESKGTHFIVLDADEAFTGNFLARASKIVSRLEPGQRLLMQWLAMWKCVDHYRDDYSVWSNNFKDFIFRDDGKSQYPNVWMHTPRTPGQYADKEKDLVLNNKFGAVMHFQFSDWDRFQIKQAWCRMSELIRDPGTEASINSKYQITLDDENAKVSALPEDWKAGIVMPSFTYEMSNDDFWRLQDISRWFETYGPEHFRNLQIWHIPQVVQVAKKK